MNYFNTTNETGQVLISFEDSAKTQDDIILELYHKTSHPMSASTVFRFLEFKKWPITSIRRSITNLMNKGYLEKTKTKTNGMYNRPEYLYRLVG